MHLKFVTWVNLILNVQKREGRKEGRKGDGKEEKEREWREGGRLAHAKQQ